MTELELERRPFAEAYAAKYSVAVDAIPDDEITRTLREEYNRDGRLPPPFALDALRRAHAEANQRHSLLPCGGSSARAAVICTPGSDAEYACGKKPLEFRGTSVCPRREELERRGRMTLMAKRMVDAKVPAEYRLAVLDGVPRGQAQRAMESVVSRRHPRIVVFSGIRGCGKSTAAAWLLAQLGGAWIDCGTLSRPAPDQEARIQDVVTRPAVVLDNIGGEYSPSGYASAMAAEIIRRAYHERAFIVATTILRKADWWCSFPESARDDIGARMKSGGAWVVVTDPDFRTRKQQG